jgi:subtilisin family serine protease/subtilisin-like proprotein convertase family protein
LKGTRIVVSRIVSLVIAAGLLAGMASGVLATAQLPPPDDQRHLLLVPSDAEGTAALARTDARVIAKYESFSLVEAQGGDDERLRRAGADRRDDMRTVETAAGKIDPLDDRRSLAGKEAPERDETLALVQFIGPPKEAWVNRLRATGARLVTYQAENAYIVHGRGKVVDRLAALQGTDPAVRTVSVLTSADRLEDRSSRSGLFAVTTVTGPPGEQARAGAAQAGAAAAPPMTVGALRTDYRALSSAEAAELAADPGVVAVEAYGEPELFDERAAQIVAGNLTAQYEPSEFNYLDWLLQQHRIPDATTFGFAIDVTDEGFDNGADPPAHPDFRELGSAGNPDRVSYVSNYTTDSDARDCGGHGTNVASIATGYNNLSDSPPQFSDDRGFNHGLGVAPFARVGASKIFRGCGDGGFSLNTTLTGVTENAYAGGARISNNSWGTGSLSAWGDYSARSREYDRLVRDARPSQAGNQAMVEVFAAGNDGEGNPSEPGDPGNEGYGTISAEGSAKNVITVGAAEGVRTLQNLNLDCDPPNTGADSARDIIDFSSRGPTDDGRLKPDLVAPGTHVTGAAPQHGGYNGAGVCHTFLTGTTFYSVVSGTSQATPQVSGAAALLRSWYQRTKSVEPSPALTKALLINTATDLADGDGGKGASIAPGPNTDQGWGRVNLGNVFDATARVFHDQLPVDVLGGSGQSRTRAYTVENTSKPVKVTLAWTDAPGPTTGNPVMNNLDLVVDARGETYKGNVFAGSTSRTGGSADSRNNVESVYLPGGMSGRFAVKVVGTNIPGNGIPGNADSTDQDFALVVSNAVEQAAPVLVHDATTIDDSPGAGGDGDGALEPGESFELDERIRNAGNAAATGTSGTLTGGTDVTITTDEAEWPSSLTVGASGTNTTRFEGEYVASPEKCGADATATLALTTGQGPQTVPLTLATGAEGTPLQWPATDPQLPTEIPDDSAAGMTSTIEVTTPARIKDLDVLFPLVEGQPGLDHNWVGDLVIDLIGPDGTRVRLVEHPGGPDNGANDLRDVVFDDQASGTIPAGLSPVVGSFRPQNDQLARFNGKQQFGTWTLRVRDLFERDTGTLFAWGITITPATCDVDATAPNTTITSANPAEGDTSPSNDATFSFTSSTPGATFQCKLNGAAFAPCDSPKDYTDLPDGTHTFRVRAVDAGKVDPTPAIRRWTIDTTPPDTEITAGPSGPVSTNSASFQFVAPDDPGASFHCWLGDTELSPCTEPQDFANLPDGSYSFKVRARDVAGNVDPSPAIRTWTVDTVAPAPAVTSPAHGSTTEDVTPMLSGTAGTAVGDDGTVTVKLYSGTLAAGLPAHTLIVPRDGVSGAWSADSPSLADGTYTVSAEQADSAGNVGASGSAVFTVDAPSPPPSPPPPPPPPPPEPVAPSFLLAPAEERLADALAGRLIVTAACASACEARAKLTVSARAARRLGVNGNARSVSLGSGFKRLSKAGTAQVRVRLSRRATAALRRRDGEKATLRVSLTEDSKTLTLSRAVSLRRSGDLRRITDKGLRLWVACSERCPMSGKLTVSDAAARRIGLRARGSARVMIASGKVSPPARSSAPLTLKVRRGAKKALRKAARVTAVLEAVAGSAADPQRPAKRSLTLHR